MRSVFLLSALFCLSLAACDEVIADSSATDASPAAKPDCTLCESSDDVAAHGAASGVAAEVAANVAASAAGECSSKSDCSSKADCTVEKECSMEMDCSELECDDGMCSDKPLDCAGGKCDKTAPAKGIE